MGEVETRSACALLSNRVWSNACVTSTRVESGSPTWGDIQQYDRAACGEAAAAGKTQKQIAAEIERSQPEVSRLLRFDGTSPLGRRVRKHAAEVKRLIAEACGSDVRVFGSVAAGEDGADSDIDLVFTMGRPLSLV